MLAPISVSQIKSVSKYLDPSCCMKIPAGICANINVKTSASVPITPVLVSIY